MGLDMYLRRKIYLNSSAVKLSLTAPQGDGEAQTIEMDEVSNITQKMMYWRKANAIHQWFVDNVQEGDDNCRPYEVEFEDLKRLRDTCAEILADPSKAMELLPPQSGFFFGSTDVDEYYLEDLKETVKAIDEEERRIATVYPTYGDGIYGIWYEYQSSW